MRTTRVRLRVGAKAVRGCVAAALGCGWAFGQGASVGSSVDAAGELPAAPSALVRPLKLTGGVALDQAPGGAMPLTLDQAVEMALKHNTELTLRVQQERFVQAARLTALDGLMPNFTATAYTQAQEINLAARGFKPGKVMVPGFSGTIPEIVKVNTTDAQLNLSQQIFNGTTILLYETTRKAAEAANWATLSARGGVVLETGALYLKALADQAMVKNAEALSQQDQAVYEHAKQSRDAGVGINLDVLRAQVTLQNEQQQLVRAKNAVAQDKIQLNREMGQPAGQDLELVDTIPFAEFDAQPSAASFAATLQTAYERRKDLRGLEAQLEIAQRTRRALKYERLPTLEAGGFYGVLGETTGLYHGVFAVEGRLNVPVFQEGTLRGQREIAVAQEIGLKQQIASRRSQIEGEIRASLLDVQSAGEQVKVARSNVELSREALGDATERFTAGVDDNLAVVRAQAGLEGAEARVVEAEFQYNYAKLTLARNSGVVETQYKAYLGR